MLAATLLAAALAVSAPGAQPLAAPPAQPPADPAARPAPAPARPPAPADPRASRATPPRAPAGPVATVREAEAKLRTALDAGADAAQLGVLAAEYLDYQDLARRSLGRHWARQSRADQAALVAALRALLEATYLTRLQPGGAGQVEVTVTRGTAAEAELHLSASSGQKQVPIDLRLQRGKDGRWRVWDATVAGLALLEGYQEQFPQLLELGGMKRLLAQLEQERQEQLGLHAPPARPAAAAPAPASPPAAPPGR